jgi:RHS repeat-associated protein
LPFGPRTRAEFPPYDSGTSANTVISTRSYNLRGQVASLQVTSPLGTVLDQSFTYGYIGGAPGPVDGGPNLDQLVDNRDSTQSRFYFYDALDRLWKSTNLSGTPIFTYVYDANGNRTQQVAPAGTTNYSYASSTDRIAQATGTGAKYYAHDAFGNRIWAGPSAYAGTPSHVYDEGNRLVEVRDPTTQAVLGQYTYDAAGRRVRKIAGGVTTLYFYDTAGHLVESQNLSTIPATRRSYVFVEDEPVGVVDQPPSGAPSFSWIHTDRLGTPLAVTSTPGTGSAKVIWRATYEPFGLATLDEDPDGDSVSFALDLRFPGQVFDAESGGYYNLYRTYDAAVGRYLNPDPIGQLGGTNVFAYAGGSPLMHADPLGLCFTCGGLAAGALTGAFYYLGSQLESGCPFDRDAFLSAVLSGALIGGAVGLAIDTLGGGASFISYTFADALGSSLTFTPGNLSAIAGTLRSAGGLVAGKLDGETRGRVQPDAYKRCHCQ